MARTKLLAAGFAVAALPALAQEVHIYGRLNIAVEQIHSSTDSSGTSLGNLSRLSNYRSVLGYNGEEDLGGGMRATWQIEGALALDNGTGGIANRDTRLGLATPYGTIFGGNWTTPYTFATSELDPFYPTTAGYMSIVAAWPTA